MPSPAAGQEASASDDDLDEGPVGQTPCHERGTPRVPGALAAQSGSGGWAWQHTATPAAHQARPAFSRPTCAAAPTKSSSQDTAHKQAGLASTAAQRSLVPVFNAFAPSAIR